MRLRVLALLLLAPTGVAGQGPGASPATDPNATPAYPIAVESAPRPTAPARRAPGGIRIDGRLDEEAWAAAEPITEFIQAQPRTGYPGSEPTVARILYDDRNLYVAAFLYDSQPVTVMSLEQDFETHDSDVFAVTLDTYLDRRNSFMFLVNPLGAVKDGQTFNDSRDINLAWEGVIHVETMVVDSGWSVEMAIPWTTLRFDQKPGAQDWGLQLLRRIRRTNEDIYWAPVDRRDRIHKMSRAGTLTGLDGLRQGRNLSLKPYGKLGRSEVPAAGGADGSGYVASDQLDAGFDLKWGLTPTLTLDGTFNTDFSQVEVDQEQVNLTRFSLFFPERREFFIENSGVFTFGDVTERNYRMGSSLRDFTLFHSRRIGLTGGRPVPILGGGRLTGTAGDFQLGLLNMQTEDTDATPAENFLVARVKRNVLGNSDIGVMLVNRAATGDVATEASSWNRSYGADANLTFFQNLVISSYLAATDAPDVVDRNTAGRVSVAWRDRLWDISAFGKQVGENFDPGVGFVRRHGVRQFYGTFGAHPRVGIPLVYGLNPYVELDYITDTHSVLESREAGLGLAAEFTDGGTLELKGTDRFERLEQPFGIADDVTLPAGDYEFRDLTLSYRSSGGRAFAGSVGITAGEFYDGTKTSLRLSGLWRASPKLSLEGRLDRNAVDLPAGSFDADAAGAKVLYALNRNFFASGFVQYNTTVDQLVTNVRLNYIHAPLSDIFLVLVERRDLGTDIVLERSIALKATKLLSF